MDRKENQTIPPKARIRLVVVFGKSGKGAGTNNSVTCFNCGKQGHKADSCWQQNRFEAWNKIMLRLLVQVKINRVLVQQMVQCMQLLRMQHM